jgi:hypothetical protein
VAVLAHETITSYSRVITHTHKKHKLGEASLYFTYEIKIENTIDGKHLLLSWRSAAKKAEYFFCDIALHKY